MNNTNKEKVEAIPTLIDNPIHAISHLTIHGGGAIIATSGPVFNTVASITGLILCRTNLTIIAGIDFVFK